MTPEAQRIAIATYLGWTPDDDGAGTGEWCTVPTALQGVCIYGHKPMPGSPGHFMEAAVPDYLNDLNAMHEAEKGLPLELRTRYITTLFGITNITGPYWTAVHATAAQRAEAFLRTLGKWEEPTP